MQASMSRKGNCYDTAPMESFWESLKNELIHHHRYATRADAKAAIQEYIESFYNRQLFRPIKVENMTIASMRVLDHANSVTYFPKSKTH